MGKWTILVAVVIVSLVMPACSSLISTSPPATEPLPNASYSVSRLTPNPVETSPPIYGGTLKFGHWIPRSFDGHQKVAYGPTATLPIFNQLVMFSLAYKETVPENIVGDLADSWETSPDGTEITFNLHPGVKWHDGIPFTADDVVYSLDKMTDFTRSAISDLFPAYQSSEVIDDNTVKVRLKYPSAGFLIALAQGYSQIQARHLAGTDGQSAEFLIGTGPFTLEDYLVKVHIKYKRNPDYWKTDKYGSQLPYLDGIIFYQTGNAAANDMLVGRRLDIKNPTTGAATLSTYDYLRSSAPELLWQKRDVDWADAIFLNTTHKPLDDIRVRRAFALVLKEDDLIVGFCGDASFGITDIGLLSRSFGLPAEEIRQIMGWDKPYEDRISEAQRLMAEAGYPDGFKLNMLSSMGAQTEAGVSLVLGDALKKYLKIDAVLTSVEATEMYKRVDEDNYDLFTTNLSIGQDPIQLLTYFETGGYANWAKYSSPEIDRLLAELDYIIDPLARRDTIWEIERILLTDLPALPTGTFIANFMPYYPHIKNIRWTSMSYSNTCRLEDVWIDESLRTK
ncbi:MAG: ABC transporter substrate-binding protein [Dehalococcoidia bacterium]|nr:MAG: ABC transporter substrate-binding protein [Dehalococcoidia bacterium]